MKIACIIHSLDGGGAERVMASLASRLSQRQHDVTLITLDDGQQDRHAVDPSVTRATLDVMADSHGLVEKLLHNRRRIHELRQAVSEITPEVVLSFCDRTNILALMALAGRVPVVIAERSDPRYQTLGKFWESQRRRTYPRAARIIALNEPIAQFLQSLSPHKVEVIESAVDRPPISWDPEFADSRRSILGIGRLEHEKGFDRLIEAFARASIKDSDWTLRILGEGSQREHLHTLAEHLGVGQRVEMPGWIRPVWEELARATVFALPSRYEGCPSALLEAMAVGVPSVAVDCESGPRTIIHHDVDGLLVEANVSALADALARLMSDSSLRRSLSQRATGVVEQFDWNKMVQRYEQVLSESR